MERLAPICNVEGCTNSQAFRGFKRGKPSYRGRCEKHGRPYGQLRQRLRPKSKDRRRIENHLCERCGINEVCDRHRLIPEIGWKKNNVLILCRSCHLDFQLANGSQKFYPNGDS
jgi:hypothetical protein